MSTVQEPIEFPATLDKTTFKFINCIEDFTAMCTHLEDRKTVKEIAVDLEHHT